MVYGELLLQPIACVEDLVAQASRVSPYGSYLRQVLSAHGTGVIHSVYVTSRRHRRHEFDHYRLSAARDARRGFSVEGRRVDVLAIFV